MTQEQKPSPPYRNEAEHQGPIWKHPYLLYILLTVVLFLGLLFIAWLANSQGWIPSRT